MKKLVLAAAHATNDQSADVTLDATPFIPKMNGICIIQKTSDYAGGTATVQYSDDGGTTDVTLTDVDGDDVKITAAGTLDTLIFEIEFHEIHNMLQASRSAGSVTAILLSN